jgi:hypothetical protein
LDVCSIWQEATNELVDEPEPRPRDGMRIYLDNPDDLAYWMKRFQCTAAELGGAVKAVGTLADRVDAWLHRLRPSANDPES